MLAVGMILPENPENPDEGSSSDGLYVLLYSELRAMAQYELSKERKSHTLSATALVNEAYLKLSKQTWLFDPSLDKSDNGDHAPSAKRRFFSVAARAMRQILVDYARTRGRKKRGGGRHAADVEFDQIAGYSGLPIVDLLAVDEALEKLTAQSPEVAKVVEMRFFAGLPEATIAETMGISERTVRRHWTFAKAWLTREMRQPD